jgi:hypothetical protein
VTPGQKGDMTCAEMSLAICSARPDVAPAASG